MSVGSFYTMVFVVDKYLKSELGVTGDDRLLVLRRILSDILNTLNVAGHGKDSLLRGINNPQFRDIEDSCQYELARLHGCEALITINISDYKDANQTRMKVLTPLRPPHIHPCFSASIRASKSNAHPRLTVLIA